MKVKPPYIPSHTFEITKKKTFTKSIKYTSSTLPESKDSIKSPEIIASKDPFIEWFNRETK